MASFQCIRGFASRQRECNDLEYLVVEVILQTEVFTNILL